MFNSHINNFSILFCFAGILSPPGPFLTPSPSPSISASPRLQPSPSLSPFPQDVLLVAGNTITNTNTLEQERKAVTPGRRQSLHQFNTNGSPNAGTVVFQPSPSQSPAADTSVIGVTANSVVGGVSLTTTATTGNEFNTTLVGSNNIQLNKVSAVKAIRKFLYPPHRGYISFVNTCGTHTNIDLRPLETFVCLSVRPSARSNHDCVRTQRDTNIKL